MIGRLKGTLIEKNPPKLLVDVQGLGYEVEVPATTFEALPAVGSEVILHTHLSIREDAHQLYGFISLNDRNVFRLLISVSGIGPKSGLAALSAMDALTLSNAIQNEDIGRLTQISGVGKKTAERLLIELRDKLPKHMPELQLGASPGSASTSQQSIHEAVQALISLGYKANDANARIEKLRKQHPHLSSQEMIRQALQSVS